MNHDDVAAYPDRGTKSAEPTERTTAGAADEMEAEVTQ